MRYRDIQEATATRKLTHGTDRGRMNEIILATAIFSKFVKIFKRKHVKNISQEKIRKQTGFWKTGSRF